MNMAQISIKLEADTEKELEAWCKSTGLSKVKTFKIALRSFFKSSEAVNLLKTLEEKTVAPNLNEPDDIEF